MDARSNQIITRRSLLRRISAGIGGAALVLVDPLRVSASIKGGSSSGAQVAGQDTGELWGQLRLLGLGATTRPAPQRPQVTAPPILEQLPGGVASIVNSSISCGDTMLRSLSWVFQYTY